MITPTSLNVTIIDCIYVVPLANKERCKFQTPTDFILKMRLFGSEEEGVWQGSLLSQT